MKRRGRPVLGGIAGLLLGIFLALDLSMFHVSPPSTITGLVLPVVLLVLGVVMGLKPPFGKRGAPEPAAPAASAAEAETQSWDAGDQT